VSVFRGRVAIVTGAASGIGLALSRALVAEGAHVVMVDIDAGRLEEAAAGLRDGPGEAVTSALDVADAEAVAAVIHETHARQGALDYLFNNAGIGVFGETENIALADWNRLLDINLRGVVHGVVAAYPLMIAQGRGHIVNTASMAGLCPSPGLVAYAASKHAVVGLSTSLRGEAHDHGVRVSAVCPGLISTGIFEAAKTPDMDMDASLELMRRAGIRPYPAERCARDILRGVRANRAIIHVTWFSRVASWCYRHFPRLLEWGNRLVVRRHRALQAAVRKKG
jgi:NAD(P)-dependent dehydrogenase (short-subunit alcohol dehydrogenase family)